jgi:RNA polymerase sigma-70 factor (ECF subfamily)
VTDSLPSGVEVGEVTSLGRTGLAPRATEAPLSSSPSRESFREIYEAHVELVWRTLRRVGVPSAAVDDVAQEVFVAIHRALPTWEGRASLRTWIYRITRNAGLNYTRGMRRRPDGVSTEAADESPHASLDPETQAANREAIEELGLVLARIDEPKREVLVLMELEGFSAPEVAELLAIPLNTVYSRLRLARAELEQLLEEGAA